MDNLKNHKKEIIFFIISFFIIFLCYKLGHPIPCLFYEITKLRCPGCGITRMVISLLNFDIKSAISYNIFAFSLLILALLYLIINLIYYTFKHKSIKISNWIYYIIIVLAIIFAILRNIPYFSFL